MRAQPAKTALDVLVESLEPLQLLLVLDNCEQIIDAVAAMVSTLLQRCPDLQILATSREILDLRGESPVQVAPLPVPTSNHTQELRAETWHSDAVTLFVDRAAEAFPDFALTDDNQPTVIRICRELEGLPLAIELAAAGMRSLSLDQIADRLSDRFSLLTRGPRGAAGRQLTLRAAVDWSYDLCSTAERQAWMGLSIFSGAFELDAAQGVLGDELDSPAVLDVLTSLIDKSIVIRFETRQYARFRMLDTIRDYGRDQLDRHAQSAELRQRHTAWYFEFARQANSTWIGRKQGESIDRLSRELPNVRQALDSVVSEPEPDTDMFLSFVTSLFRFWLARGMTGEGRYWMRRALVSIDGVGNDPVEYSRALFVGSFWAELQADLVEGSSIVKQLRNFDASEQNPLIHARTALAEGFLALFTGDTARALSMLKRALEIFEDEGDLCTQVETLLVLGWLYGSLGNDHDTLGSFNQVIAITEAAGEEVYRSHAYWGAGVALWRTGQPKEAEATLRRGVRLARRRSDPFIAALCMESLAWVAQTQGDTVRAGILITAAETTVQLAGSSAILFPSMRAYHEGCARNVRRGLGDTEFEKIRRRARSLSLAAAAAYTLDEPNSDDIEVTTEESSLTTREREVAECVAEGLTNKAIAAKLVIAPRTAQGHVQNILMKLGFTRRTQIAVWVIEQDRAPGPS